MTDGLRPLGWVSRAGQEGRVAIVAIEGEVDMSNAAALQAQILGAVAPDQLGLVLDLGAVEHLDSSASQLLALVERRLRAAGQALRVVRPREEAPAMLVEITLLDELIEFADDVVAARRSLEAG